MPSSPHHPSPAPTSDLDTDPGRPDPYESLYRSRPGEAALPSRPTPRHFEPHLSRPEGAQEGFGWLYRTDPVAVPAATGAALPVEPPARASRRPLIAVLLGLAAVALVVAAVVLFW